MIQVLTPSLKDVTTRGSYYPDKSMATAAVGLNLLFTYIPLPNMN